MRFKLKITVIIIVVAALIAALPLFSAFNLKAAKINSSFTQSSTYKVEDVEKAAVVQKEVSIKDDSIKTETILSRISDNLDEGIDSINKEYKAEVLGSTTTSKATDISENGGDRRVVATVFTN